MSHQHKPHTPSVFAETGFVVCKQHCGVYHLQQYFGANGELTFDGVGLIYCVDPNNVYGGAQLFELNLQQVFGMPAEASLIHVWMENWANLNAGRLEESGIDPIAWDVYYFGGVIEDRVIEVRPRGEGAVRVMARMASGEMLCYN